MQLAGAGSPVRIMGMCVDMPVPVSMPVPVLAAMAIRVAIAIGQSIGGYGTGG